METGEGSGCPLDALTVVPRGLHVSGFRPPHPGEDGQIVIDASVFGVKPPDISRKGTISYHCDYTFESQSEPMPLIPQSFIHRAKLRLHQSRQQAYLFYNKVESRWTPSIPYGGAYGQIAIVDTRINTPDAHDARSAQRHLLENALWSTAVINLGRPCTVTGRVPYNLPIHRKGGRGVDLEVDNPIRTMVFVHASDMKSEARLGTITTNLELVLSTSPLGNEPLRRGVSSFLASASLSVPRLPGILTREDGVPAVPDGVARRSFSARYHGSLVDNRRETEDSSDESVATAVPLHARSTTRRVRES